MNKQQFLEKLRAELSVLPQNDAEERLLFYSKIIDDKIEEGLSEEKAVEEAGSVEEIASQIKAELLKVAEEPVSEPDVQAENPPENASTVLPEVDPQEEKKSARKLKGWEIALLILGSPLWVPLLIAFFAVALSIYISVWAIVLSLYSVAIAVAVCVIGCIALAVLFFVIGRPAAGCFSIGAAFICAGVSIFLFIGCLAITKALVKLTALIFVRKNKKTAKKEVNEQ
ncbi:MAG: DUF1700 domain-containing protein [Oscillospiraceae bacterium]|nr:DUF1700 domain-containing protein [Oscillospiraceae bacterium]